MKRIVYFSISGTGLLNRTSISSTMLTPVYLIMITDAELVSRLYSITCAAISESDETFLTVFGYPGE